MIEEPRSIKEGYVYIDEESEQWKLKANAPAWAVDDFKQFMKQVNPSEDKNGTITNY
ncbi:MAG: hypothetical protein RR537_07670 [Longicatena sp.]